MIIRVIIIIDNNNYTQIAPHNITTINHSPTFMDKAVINPKCTST